MNLIQVGTNVWIDPDVVMGVSGFNTNIPTTIFMACEFNKLIEVKTDWTVLQVVKAVTEES